MKTLMDESWPSITTCPDNTEFGHEKTSIHQCLWEAVGNVFERGFPKALVDESRV
jgi:hypothetical protein